MTAAMKALLLAVHPDTGGSHDAAVDLLKTVRPVPATLRLSEADARLLSWLERGEMATSEIVSRLSMSQSFVRSRLRWLELHGAIHAERRIVTAWPYGRRPVLVWRAGKKPMAHRPKALVA